MLRLTLFKSNLNIKSQNSSLRIEFVQFVYFYVFFFFSALKDQHADAKLY